jgi:hypothetical protein
MANTFRLKRSSVPLKIPQTTDLQLGELAINTYDGRLYLKKQVNSVDTVVEIGGNFRDGMPFSDWGLITEQAQYLTESDWGAL